MRLQPAFTLRALNGMVCAIDHLAASAGLSMLRAGGNAVDAAVATSAVLAVTSQHLCGMGGDLLAVVVAPGSEPVALNSSGRAGSGADPERLRSRGLTTMPFRDDISVVTVPGCVDGWLALHGRYGRLPIAEVLSPAIGYATDGFPVSPTLAEEFSPVAHLPGAADYTSVGPLRPGTVVRRPGVARALEVVATGDRDAFYQGEFGEELLFVGDGEFTAEDLTTPLAEWAPALSIDAFGARLWTVPPNSQGYLTLSSAYIASGLELPSDPDDPLLMHLLIEATRQASFDRLDVLADGVPGDQLLDRDELDRRRKEIRPDRAADLGDHYSPGGTIGLCAVDGDGMGVSLIQSNASGFGSRIVLPGLRIFLHNRGIGFSLEKGHPAEYGPGRRPPHTLSPTAVTLADGTLRGVLGTMGADSQPHVLLQLLARWLHAGEPPGDALAAARFSLVDPDGGTAFDAWRGHGRVVVSIEDHGPVGLAQDLAARGHQVRLRPAFHREFGHAHLISVEDGVIAGGTDPRTRAGGVAAF